MKILRSSLHKDFYNIDKQGEVNQLNMTMEEIETRIAKGAAIRSRIYNDNKWETDARGIFSNPSVKRMLKLSSRSSKTI